MAKIANPQGKGNHLLNNHWYPPIASQAIVALKEKSEKVILNDFLLSSLVLSAEFSFKPVPGNDYYLYLWKGILRLSLIPADKCRIDHVETLARCQLMPDLTWKVEFISDLTPACVDFLEAFVEHFTAHLNQDVSMAELLPVYEESLPFYRRLFASGLAKSLGISMESKNLLMQKSSEVVSSHRQLLINQTR